MIKQKEFVNNNDNLLSYGGSNISKVYYQYQAENKKFYQTIKILIGLNFQ